jgi:hypothetical protein
MLRGPLFPLDIPALTTLHHTAPETVLAVQHLTSDYLKALPSYFSKLEVPFMAISEVGPFIPRSCALAEVSTMKFSESELWFEKFLRNCAPDTTIKEKPGQVRPEQAIAFNPVQENENLQEFFYTNPLDGVEYHIVRGCVPLSV